MLEGSTLGGLIIAKILQRNLQLPQEKGFTFFSGYGAETDNKWTAFKDVLATWCSELAMYTALSASADRTFIQLKNWALLIYQDERAKEKL